MTQEEKKAKAYDEALERARKLKENPQMVFYEYSPEEGDTICDYIFPELKESEDERMRNVAINACKYMVENFENSTKQYEDAIVWLEKQGEQKPVIDFKAKNWYVSKVDGKIHDMTYNSTDKVEPKFKIGDVLCDKSCTTLNKNSQPNIEILDIRDGMYICNNCSFPISQQDEYELVTKKIEPQSAWSEEDNKWIESLMQTFEDGYFEGFNQLKSYGVIDWLKSIKQRIGG